MTRHSAGRATYPGDCRSMIGEVKGPTTYGAYTVAVSAVYFAATDTTRVEFAHLADEDKPRVVDDHGVLRLPELSNTPTPKGTE